VILRRLFELFAGLFHPPCDSSSKYAKNEEITKTPSRSSRPCDSSDFGGLCPNKTSWEDVIVYKVSTRRNFINQQLHPFEESNHTGCSLRRSVLRMRSSSSSEENSCVPILLAWSLCYLFILRILGRRITRPSRSVGKAQITRLRRIAFEE
jgi:hypothetical protein